MSLGISQLNTPQQKVPGAVPTPDPTMPLGNLTSKIQLYYIISLAINLCCNCLVCGGFYWGQHEIATPNYPDNYPNDVDCYWYCQSLQTGKSNFKIEKFSTEVTNDYLTIYGGFSIASTVLLPNKSGNLLTLPFTANTEKLLVHFHSDSVNTNKGFIALFN